MPWSTRFVLLLSCGLGGDEKKSQGTCLCGWGFYTQLYPWIHLDCVRLGHLGRQVVLEAESEGSEGHTLSSVYLYDIFVLVISTSSPPLFLGDVIGRGGRLL